MKNLRSGSKVTIDGNPGEVWKKSGDRALIHWFEGEPIRTPSGKSLGWSSERTHMEWVKLDSDRLGDA